MASGTFACYRSSCTCLTMNAIHRREHVETVTHARLLGPFHASELGPLLQFHEPLLDTHASTAGMPVAVTERTEREETPRALRKVLVF